MTAAGAGRRRALVHQAEVGGGRARDILVGLLGKAGIVRALDARTATLCQPAGGLAVLNANWSAKARL